MGSADGQTGPLGPGPRLLLSFFGLGWVPFAPGTAGSLGTAAAIFGASRLGLATGLGVAAALLLYGVVVTLAWGGLPKKDGGAGDPGWVVSDEVAGQALASLAALFGTGLLPHLVAFAAFRVFDIWKPGGIRRLEHLPGGIGVLLDDVAAAVPAALLVALGLAVGFAG